ncbi:unnamed protein product [Rhizophagus irregularis]|nr:unnamed protein product [Rhizophagus irregularis]
MWKIMNPPVMDKKLWNSMPKTAKEQDKIYGRVIYKVSSTIRPIDNTLRMVYASKPESIDGETYKTWLQTVLNTRALVLDARTGCSPESELMIKHTQTAGHLQGFHDTWISSFGETWATNIIKQGYIPELPKYFAWKPDPYATVINALLQPWENELWTNPPCPIQEIRSMVSSYSTAFDSTSDFIANNDLTHQDHENPLRNPKWKNTRMSYLIRIKAFQNKLSTFSYQRWIQIHQKLCLHISGHGSAISEIHEHIDGNSVGSHPDVLRTLQAIYVENPPPTHSDDPIDITSSFDYIRELGENSD